MFKVNNKDMGAWCFYCILWINFTRYFSLSIVNFEQVHFFLLSLILSLSTEAAIGRYFGKSLKSLFRILTNL